MAPNLPSSSTASFCSASYSRRTDPPLFSRGDCAGKYAVQCCAICHPIFYRYDEMKRQRFSALTFGRWCPVGKTDNSLPIQTIRLVLKIYVTIFVSFVLFWWQTIFFDIKWTKVMFQQFCTWVLKSHLQKSSSRKLGIIRYKTKKRKKQQQQTITKARKGGFSSKVILNSLANLHWGIGYPFGGGGGNPLYGLFRYMRPQRV